VAAAVSISALNIVRLVQVRRRVGIQPYERAYLGLALPAGAAVLAAVLANALLSSRPWWVSLTATAVCGLAAYVAFLPFVLPADERVAFRRLVARGSEMPAPPR
jgi:hypothetical protein